MLEIVGVLVCLGAPAPDKANCYHWDDAWGPYETVAECAARVAEIKDKWPIVAAMLSGYQGPVVTGPVECTKVKPLGELV